MTWVETLNNSVRFPRWWRQLHCWFTSHQPMPVLVPPSICYRCGHLLYSEKPK